MRYWVLALVCLFGVTAWGARKPICESLLEGGAEDARYEKVVRTESLSSLVEGDPKKNLIYQHPLLAMEASQKLLAIVYSQGVQQDSLHHKPKNLKRYNIFSSPSKINAGKYIVGQEQALASLVGSLESFVFSNKRKVPGVVGPHGTGKSLLIEIFRHALTHLTLNEPDYYEWSYEWVGLEKIPKLAALGFGGQPLRAYLNDSPVALLPKMVLPHLEKMLTERLKPFGVGEARFPEEMVPQNTEIRDAILEHYASQANKTLTPKDVVRVLNDHVRLRRVVMGEDGTAPLVDAQGRDYDYASLFASRVMKVAALSQSGGQGNPLAWSYGVVPLGHRSLLFADEFFRNDPKLRDIYLRVMESRNVQVSSFITPLDMWIITAFNTASLNDVASDPKGDAHIDRLDRINMWWSVYPHEIIKTMLFMQGAKNLIARPLHKEGGVKVVVGANLDKVFPLWLEGQGLRLSDNRYELWVKVGDEEEVHISPHVLLYMASIASLTRQNFDAEKAQKELPKGSMVLQTPVFKHEARRLKWLLGEEMVPSGDVTRAMLKLQKIMREGDYGMSARDLSLWFSQAISMARENPENDMTLVTARKAFDFMLENAKFKASSDGEEDGGGLSAETRMRWSQIAALVLKVIQPRLSRGVHAAFVGRDMAIQKYRDFTDMLWSISSSSPDERPMHYYPAGSSSERRVINYDFVETIKKHYEQENNGEPLDIHKLASAMYFKNQGKPHADEGEWDESNLDPSLLSAINSYLRSKATVQMEWDDIAHALDGQISDPSTRGRAQQMVSNLAALGYTEYGAKEAIRLMADEAKLAREKARSER